MDFTSIFNGEALTLAQFNEKTKGMKLADLSTGEYVAKGKDNEQKEEIESLKRQLAEKDETSPIWKKQKAMPIPCRKSWTVTNRRKQTGKKRKRRHRWTPS